MKVVDLSDEHLGLYLACLQDWSQEVKEQGDRRKRWYDVMKDEGLRVKLAVDDRGVVGGMIHYVPIERSSAEGKDLYFVDCIWVHAHKQGQGDMRGMGMGKALLAAAEQDVKALGRKGLVVWGVSLPVWMRARWFKRQGYEVVDKEGIMVLMWKPFAGDASPPKWIRQKKGPALVPGKVTVTAFTNGWCSAANIVCERAKRAASEFGEKVAYREISTLDREVLKEYGISDGLFIDDREVRTGPPPSYDKIRRLIEKRVKKLGR